MALIMEKFGAIVDGTNPTRTIEDSEIPYDGMLQITVYLMTQTATEPAERDGITYISVVDDLVGALKSAKQDA
ncbi:hypothetical protein [Glutamicibacter nicotianae]